MSEDFEVPFGKARIRREGTDLSIITYGNTTHFCLHVAEQDSRIAVNVAPVQVNDPKRIIWIWTNCRRTI